MKVGLLEENKLAVDCRRCWLHAPGYNLSPPDGRPLLVIDQLARLGRGVETTGTSGAGGGNYKICCAMLFGAMAALDVTLALKS